MEKINLSKLTYGVCDEKMIRDLIAVYGTSTIDWFFKDAIHHDVVTSSQYDIFYNGLFIPDYWSIVSFFTELSEEFLKEYDRHINKRKIFIYNYSTCKNLSLDYVVLNVKYIENIDMFEFIFSEEDYNILKNLYEVRR